MTDTPTLVFLHGVHTDEYEERWVEALSRSLTGIGYPDLSEVTVIAPRYGHALKGDDGDVPLPPVSVKPMKGDDRRGHRRDFDHRIAAMEYRLARHDRGNGAIWADVAVSLATPVVPQARNYLRNTNVRAQVLTRILSELPDTGRIVIVAHSLGTVIAADILCRLPVGVEVVGLVTLGSPLAEGNYDVDDLRKKLADPPANLGWWVNFWSAFDPVVALRGVSSVVPWLLDLKVPTAVLPLRAHGALNYLAAPHVAEAVGYGLFGSRSKEMALVESAAGVALDGTQIAALRALRYAHLIKDLLTGDEAARFSGALRYKQALVVEDLVTLAKDTGRPVPYQVCQLRFDYGDPSAQTPVPGPADHTSKEEAAAQLVSLAVQNLLSPFEIDIPADVQKEAMSGLAAEMGLGTRFGSDVFDSMASAEKAISGRGTNWMKWGAMGAGLVAITVATAGLAAAPAAGLSGAAVVTSALAGFGPGGMIGGLLTAGTLVSAGSGSVAIGVVSPTTTARQVESLVKIRLAVAILQGTHNLQSDDSIWLELVDIERQLIRKAEWLEEFSDPKSASVQAIRQKLDAVRAALKYMSDNGLAPDVIGEEDEDAADKRVGWLPTPRGLSR